MPRELPTPTFREFTRLSGRVYIEDTEPYCHIYIPVKADIGRNRVTIQGVSMAVYQAMWLYLRGPIPEGALLLHSCDRGDEGCVNVNHLRLGTHAENNADAIERGRQRNQNHDKTHCPQGHPYNYENTRIRPNGQRACRACDRERKRRG
jgi:hypothetical protein